MHVLVRTCLSLPDCQIYLLMKQPNWTISKQNYWVYCIARINTEHSTAQHGKGRTLWRDAVWRAKSKRTINPLHSGTNKHMTCWRNKHELMLKMLLVLLSVRLSVCPPVRLSACPSACPFIYLSVATQFNLSFLKLTQWDLAHKLLIVARCIQAETS